MYALGGHDVVFEWRPPSGTPVDTAGRTCQQTDTALMLADGSLSLPRYVAQRAFWFGWYAHYRETQVIGAER